jgi:hypothetical protein
VASDTGAKMAAQVPEGVKTGIGGSRGCDALP